MSVQAAVVPTLPPMMVLMPWLVTPAPPPKAPKVAAVPKFTGARQAVVPVLKVVTLLTARALPARSFTPVAPEATVTVNVRLAVKPAGAVGVKVATWLAAL